MLCTSGIKDVNDVVGRDNANRVDLNRNFPDNRHSLHVSTYLYMLQLWINRNNTRSVTKEVKIANWSTNRRKYFHDRYLLFVEDIGSNNKWKLRGYTACYLEMERAFRKFRMKINKNIEMLKETTKYFYMTTSST